MPIWPWRTRRSRIPVPKAVVPSAKRSAVDVLVPEHYLSKARACRIAGLSRAVPYRESANPIGHDAPVGNALNETAAQDGRRGFWKYFQRLCDQGYAWNHKHVHRVYCSMKPNLTHRTKKQIITRERQPILAPEAVNPVWALHFMHDPLYGGKVCRWAELHGIELRYVQPGKPNPNAFVECFNKSVRQEVLDARLFDSLSQAQQIPEGWRIEYNVARSHEPLGKGWQRRVCQGWQTPKPQFSTYRLDGQVYAPA